MTAAAFESWRRAAILTAVLASVACSSDPSGPTGDDSGPGPGSKASGTTDASGNALIVFGRDTATVRVVDAGGLPATGVKVGVTVGNSVFVVAASDPTGARPPGFAVYPVSRLAPTASLVAVDPNVAQPVVIETITLTLLAIGLVGGLIELLGDPIHPQVVIDNGVVKSCIAGDWNDVLAVVGPVLDAGVSTVLTKLGHSKSLVLAAELVLLDVSEVLSWLDVMDRDRLFACQILVGDGDFSLQLVVISTVTGGGILAQDAQLPSRLWFVEPLSNGSDLHIGPIRTSLGSSPTITDMAVWEKVAFQQGSTIFSHPVLYAASFNALYRLNRRTAIAEPIGNLGNRGINALTSSPSGELYAMGQSAELLQLDAETGAIVRITPLSLSVASSGDLSFLPDGRLVATVTGFAGDRLVRIDPTTGTVQILGDVGFFGVFGLAYFANTLWGVTTDGYLLRINTQTGRGTVVRSLAFSANGGSARHRAERP